MNALESGNSTIPLGYHFAAGALSGLAQSVIMDTYEVLHYWYPNRHKTTIFNHFAVGVNLHAVTRRLLHNVVGFATLFGCYEAVRRTIAHRALDYFSSESDTIPQTLYVLDRIGLIEKRGNEMEGRCSLYSMPIIPLSASFVAGGVAGQISYVMNYYSRQWRFTAFSHPKVERSDFKVRTNKLHHPNMRAVANSFPPMAIAFLAFQYGGEIAESILNDRSDTSHFLILVKQNLS